MNIWKQVSTVLGIALAFSTTRLAQAAWLIVDVNQIGYVDLSTMTELYPDEEAKAGLLRADGIWVANAAQSTSVLHWGHILDAIAPRGWLVSEDLFSGGTTPRNDATQFNAVTKIAGRHPDAAFVYSEPYPTLTGPEIAEAAQAHGGKVVLDARAYSGQQKLDVDAALKNTKVSGIAFEATADWHDMENNAIADGVNRVLQDKTRYCYVILSPGAQHDFPATYAEKVKDALSYLQHHKVNMDSDRLFIVFAAYSRTPGPTGSGMGFLKADFGSNSIQAGLDYAKGTE